MSFEVVAADEETVTLWDGVTKEDKHPSLPGGTMRIWCGAHPFEKGNKINIVLRLVSESEPEQPAKVDNTISNHGVVRCPRCRSDDTDTFEIVSGAGPEPVYRASVCLGCHNGWNPDVPFDRSE